MLEAFYEVPRERVAELMRAAIALPSIGTVGPPSLVRALEIYEVDRLDFAEAYLVAQAEATGVNTVLSFDRTIGRVTTVTRREPRVARATTDHALDQTTDHRRSALATVGESVSSATQRVRPP